MRLRTKTLGPGVYVWASLAALLVIALHWVHPGYTIAQSDINPPDDIWNQIHQCWLPWNYTQSYLGQQSSCFAYAPYLVYQGILQTALGASFGQGVSLTTPLIVGWLGCFFCLRRLQCSDAVSAVVAWVYTLNPYTQVLLGLNITALLFAAIFPWTCYCLISAAKAPQSRAKCSFVLIIVFTVALPVLAITPQLLVEFAFGVLLWIGVSVFLAPDRESYARWLITRLPLIALVSCWWLVPVAISIAGAKNAHATTLASNAAFYVRSSLLNNLRLNGVWLWNYDYYFGFAQSYDANPVTYGSGFLLLAGLLYGLWRLDGVALKITRLLGLASLVIFFIAKGPHDPFPQINYFIYSLPLLYAFIEPAGLIYIAIFSLSAVLAFALQRYTQNSVTPARTIVVLTGSVAVAAISAYAVLTGQVFHGINANLPSMYSKIPDYWNAAAKAIQTTSHDEGIAVLPADAAYQAYYAWGYKGADTIPAALFNRRILLPGPPFGYLTSQTRDSIYDKVVALLRSDSPLLAPALKSLGIRFIVYREDVLDASQAIPLSDVIKDVKPRKVLHFGPLSVLDLGTPADTVAFATTPVETVGKISAGSMTELKALEGNDLPHINVTDLPSAQAPLFTEYVDPASWPSKVLKNSVVLVSSSPFTLQSHPTELPRGITDSTRRLTITTSFSPGIDEISNEPQVNLYYGDGLFSGALLKGVPLPVIIPSSWRKDGLQRSAAIFNPASGATAITMLIHLRSAQEHSLRLSINGVPQRPAISADRASIAVTLMPAINSVTFDATNQDTPALVRPEDVQFEPRQKQTDLVVERTATLSKTLRHVVVGVAPLRVKLSRFPQVWPSISQSAWGQPGLVLQVSAKGAPFLCYASLYNWAWNDLNDALTDCLSENRASFGSLRVDDIRVEAVGVDFARTNSAVDGHVATEASVAALNIRWNDSRAAVLTVPVSGIKAAPQLTVAWPGDLSRAAVIGVTVSAHPLDDFSETAAQHDCAIPLLQLSNALLFSHWILPRHETPCADLRLPHDVAATVTRFVPPTVALNGYFKSNVKDSTVWVADFPATARLMLRTQGTSGASLIVIGKPRRSGADVDPQWRHITGNAYVAQVPSSGYLSTTIGYHSSWIALQGLHVLRHFEADGWRNAWYVPTKGRVYLLNLLDCLAGMLAVLAAIVVVLQGRAAWKH